MSARGARSRKAVAKDIEKQEKKAEVKGKSKAVETIRRPNDAFQSRQSVPVNPPLRDPALPSRQQTISNNLNRASRTSSTGDGYTRPPFDTVGSQDSYGLRPGLRPRTSTSGSTSISDGSSSVGREQKKYAMNGKETKAPRGRRGGVPVKKPVSAMFPLSLGRADTSLSYQPPTYQKTWMNFRIWEGGDLSMKPYAGFDYVSLPINFG
jgi:hypothetical protein